MSKENYMTNILELKDKNITFYDNFYHKEKIKGFIHKVFEGYLSYKPEYCPKCGVIFDDNFVIEKEVNVKVNNGEVIISENKNKNKTKIVSKKKKSNIDLYEE